MEMNYMSKISILLLMSLLERIIYHREKLLKSLSPEQVKLMQPILDIDPKQLVWNVWHTWWLRETSVSPIKEANTVPVSLIPDIEDQTEFASYMSNLLKGLI